MNTRDYILDHTGGSWENIIAEFAGLNLEQTLEKLNSLFPSENNAELANAIILALARED